jgi:hypothetical protein
MNTVRIGPATIVGYLLSALAAGGAVIAAAEHELSGSGKWLVITSAVTAIATNLGRQLQAMPASSGIPAPPAAPDAASLAALKAQADANVLKAEPDGVDSAQVPFSGATP